MSAPGRNSAAREITAVRTMLPGRAGTGDAAADRPDARSPRCPQQITLSRWHRRWSYLTHALHTCIRRAVLISQPELVQRPPQYSGSVGLQNPPLPGGRGEHSSQSGGSPVGVS